MLGKYLLEDGAITEEELESALARQRALSERGERRRLGELMVEMGLISERQLRAALERQERSP